MIKKNKHSESIETQTVISAITDNSVCLTAIVKHPDNMSSDDVIEILRKIINEYLQSDAGKSYNESINNDFNWGDAFNQIPLPYFKKFKIKIVSCNAADVIVEHDECFC